jgi:hypothetical protein
VIIEEGGATNAKTFTEITLGAIKPTLLSTNGRMIYIYTPAPIPDHPLHTVVEQKAKLQDSYFTATIHSCPLYTPHRIQQFAKEFGGETSLIWKREFLCQHERDSSKTCIPEFDEALHVKPLTTPPAAPHWIAMDVGGLSSFTAAHLYAYDYVLDQVQVVAEVTLQPNSSDPAIVQAIETLKAKANSKDIPVYLDAAGSTRANLSNTYGLSFIFPSKPKTDGHESALHGRLSSIRDALTLSKLIIDPSCKLLITTLRSATFNSSRTDYQYSDLTGDADHLDCLIYGYRHRITHYVLPRSSDASKAMEERIEALSDAMTKPSGKSWWEQD